MQKGARQFVIAGVTRNPATAHQQRSLLDAGSSPA
jgi:hypothetical protein